MSTTIDPGKGQSPLTDPAFRDRLKDLPPSAKLVAHVLSRTEPLAQGELVDTTLLPPRTVRYALTRLGEAELVASRHSFRDARKQVYYLTP
ncbi:MAG: helix-turn-helix domain-containing protein [Halobacteriales archaeon]|nr:helix-turn-helix domain-containing protein [Halobacteriales archaeon]